MTLHIGSIVRRMNKTLVIVLSALAIAALVARIVLDQRVLSLVVRTQVSWHSGLWGELFTRLGKAWLLVWLLLLWFAISRRRQHVLAGLLALTLVGIVVNPLKIAVGRPRPRAVLKAQETGQPSQKLSHYVSFPSGDTAVVFACATAILVALRWPLRVLALAAAVAIGILRVTAKAHYPSDVLAGAAIGILLGWLAMRLVERWGWSDRPVPVARELLWGGLLGIPVVVGFSEGLAKMLLFTATYGLLILAIGLIHRALSTEQKPYSPTMALRREEEPP